MFVSLRIKWYEMNPDVWRSWWTWDNGVKYRVAEYYSGDLEWNHHDIYIYILLDFISWLFSYSLVVVYEHLHWGWQFWTLGSTDWMIYTWVSEWLKLDDWNWIHPRMTKRELELKGAYWKGPIILTMFTNPVLLWTAGSGSEKELVAAASVLASKGSPA